MLNRHHRADLSLEQPKPLELLDFADHLMIQP
jgi:hypothetical protein